MVSNNAINANDTGLIRYDGTGVFDSVTTTNHNLLIGAASNGITSVAPSATSGVPIISQGASSDPTFGTMVVSGGGTGTTSFTAYSIIAGGTTSTGALQNVSGVGTSGQVLTSNGPSALPTWQPASGGAGFNSTIVSGQLSSAQVKSLMASPVLIASAPGANKLIVPFYAWARMNYGGTNAFTGAIATITLTWDATGTPLGTSFTLLANAVVTGTTTQITIKYSPQPRSTVGTASGMINKALYIYNSIADFGGNAAGNNTVDYYIVYVTLDV